MTKIIIVRHGNTFASHETPRRVGMRTDLPLVARGIEQANEVAQFLKKFQLIPDVALTSQLQRTKQTYAEIVKTLGISIRQEISTDLNEIDYGPDENKADAEIIKRIGKTALEGWNLNAKAPPDWAVDGKKMKKTWLSLADRLVRIYRGKKILLVTSNGVARFSPIITGDFAGFARQNQLKMATGSISVFEHTKLENHTWASVMWNQNPNLPMGEK